MVKFNAYDLRTDKYRYLRGNSDYIEKAEALFNNGIIVPSGMAAISLVMQFYGVKSIWYPDDIYQGTFELIQGLGLIYDDKNPDMVIYDYPSFRGIYWEKKFPNSIIVADNSVEPFRKPECDIIVTSLSKYHTNCETVLGLITLCSDRCIKDKDRIAELRWKSGYVVFEEQVNTFFKHYCKFKTITDFKNYVNQFKLVALIISEKLSELGIENVLSGGLVFVLLPDELDPREVALASPFNLCPTYGAEVTFLTYSYCEDNLRYFGNDKRKGNYLRVSPGLVNSFKIAEDIALSIYKAIKDVERRNFYNG